MAFQKTPEDALSSAAGKSSAKAVGKWGMLKERQLAQQQPVKDSEVMADTASGMEQLTRALSEGAREEQQMQMGGAPGGRLVGNRASNLGKQVREAGSNLYASMWEAKNKARTDEIRASLNAMHQSQQANRGLNQQATNMVLQGGGAALTSLVAPIPPGSVTAASTLLGAMGTPKVG